MKKLILIFLLIGLNANSQSLRLLRRLAENQSVKSITLSTTSTSSTWSPTSVINGGSTLTWDVTGGFVGSQTADDPTFNLSTNSGTADMNIYDVIGVTTFNKCKWC